jgi:hypothetical protein
MQAAHEENEGHEGSHPRILIEVHAMTPQDIGNFLKLTALVSTQIAVMQALFCFLYGVQQLPVADILFPCKARKPPGFEYPHGGPLNPY